MTWAVQSELSGVMGIQIQVNVTSCPGRTDVSDASFES